MVFNIKNRYIVIVALGLVFVNAFFVFSESKLLNNSVVGPGHNEVVSTISEATVSEATVSEATISEATKNVAIKSDLGVFIHDGIKYVKGEYVGNFSLTGYCACDKCGTGTGLTASGRPVRENHTIASDWSVLPKYTMIILENANSKNGISYDGVYQVEDRGGGVKNNHIDIYRPTHDLASLVTYYGKCYGDVYIAMPIDE